MNINNSICEKFECCALHWNNEYLTNKKTQLIKLKVFAAYTCILKGVSLKSWKICHQNSLYTPSERLNKQPHLKIVNVCILAKCLWLRCCHLVCKNLLAAAIFVTMDTVASTNPQEEAVNFSNMKVDWGCIFCDLSSISRQ